MKDIGQKLKEARENMQLEIIEVAEDLKLRPSQIENIEDGNMDSFSDILSLKSFIKEYSKYLGLNYEDMVDDFNEYLFDYTSKVSLNDIKKAKQKLTSEKKQEQNRIASPYTLSSNTKTKFFPILIIVMFLIVLSLIIYFLLKSDNNQKEKDIIAINAYVEGV